MNDKIEHRGLARHKATQTACSHWAPIVPRSADTIDVGAPDSMIPKKAEHPLATVDNSPA